jgi:hypothetical protein
MLQCLFYQATGLINGHPPDNQNESNISQTSVSRCKHRYANRDTQDHITCNGEFTQCCVRLDCLQLSEFVQLEMRTRRVQLVYNNHDEGGVLKIENDSWIAMELTRRFGRRQSRGEKTVLAVRDHGFTFSRDSNPACFGDSVVFPLAAI